MIILELLRNGNLKKYLISKRPKYECTCFYKLLMQITALIIIIIGKVKRYHQIWQHCCLTLVSKCRPEWNTCQRKRSYTVTLLLEIY